MLASLTPEHATDGSSPRPGRCATDGAPHRAIDRDSTPSDRVGATGGRHGETRASNRVLAGCSEAVTLWSRRNCDKGGRLPANGLTVERMAMSRGLSGEPRRMTLLLRRLIDGCRCVRPARRRARLVRPACAGVIGRRVDSRLGGRSEPRARGRHCARARRAAPRARSVRLRRTARPRNGHLPASGHQGQGDTCPRAPRARSSTG